MWLLTVYFKDFIRLPGQMRFGQGVLQCDRHGKGIPLHLVLLRSGR